MCCCAFSCWRQKRSRMPCFTRNRAPSYMVETCRAIKRRTLYTHPHTHAPLPRSFRCLSFTDIPVGSGVTAYRLSCEQWSPRCPPHFSSVSARSEPTPTAPAGVGSRRPCAMHSSALWRWSMLPRTQRHASISRSRWKRLCPGRPSTRQGFALLYGLWGEQEFKDANAVT